MKVVAYDFIGRIPQEKNGTFELKGNFTLYANLVIKGQLFYGTFFFTKGFKWDGLSVPKLFQWFLPNYDKNNPLYNIAGMVHDWLYSTQGNDNMFSREECDDIFRGLLRDSGISRFKAGVADKCVQLFAGGKNHWGNDKYKSSSKGRLFLNKGRFILC